MWFCTTKTNTLPQWAMGKIHLFPLWRIQARSWGLNHNTMHELVVISKHRSIAQTDYDILT